MGYTLEDAWQEEAYDRMVSDILREHKGDVIDDFVSERMASYYKAHPDIDAPVLAVIDEAEKVVSVSPSAALLLSTSAIEITLRDVLLKPLAQGFVHDEDIGPLIAEMVISNQRFANLLLDILNGYGADFRTFTPQGSKKALWNTIEELRKVRNGVAHRGLKATLEDANRSLAIARFLIGTFFPKLKKRIVD